MKKRSVWPAGGVIIALALMVVLATPGPGNSAQAQVTTTAMNEPIVAGPRVHSDPDIPVEPTPVVVPANITWTRAELLGILWTFVTAIVVGPVVLFFHKDAPKPSPRR